MNNIDLTLRVGSDVIKPISVVHDLAVLLDQELSMKQNICLSVQFSDINV